MQTFLTIKSRNTKTGPIPVSTTSAASCPDACPLSGKNGCYAESGPLGMFWKKVTEKRVGASYADFPGIWLVIKTKSTPPRLHNCATLQSTRAASLTPTTIAKATRTIATLSNAPMMEALRSIYRETISTTPTILPHLR